MTKRDGWSITDEGRAALAEFATPELLYSEMKRRYRDVDQQRKQAMQALNEIQRFIAGALKLVRAGTWAARDDLDELAGTTPIEAAHYLASYDQQRAVNEPVTHACSLTARLHQWLRTSSPRDDSYAMTTLGVTRCR
jgi:hypothetical protein